MLDYLRIMLNARLAKTGKVTMKLRTVTTDRAVRVRCSGWWRCIAPTPVRALSA